jgi:predicted amidohydrolase
MRIACYQFTPSYGDTDGNLQRLRRALKPGPPEGRSPDLVVLPELCTTGYTFGSREEARRLAEPCGGPTEVAFTELAAHTGSTYVYGFCERDGEHVYNSAAAVGPGGRLGVYRKLHLFDRETEWFDPGDDGFVVVDVDGTRVGMMICFDWFFPESMRTLALLGAEVVAHPSNLVLPWCQQSMPVRCRENHVAAVTCNRGGTEARAGLVHTFTGGSVICGFAGETLRRAEPDGDQWLAVTLEPHRASDRSVGAIADQLAHLRPEHYVQQLATEEDTP